MIIPDCIKEAKAGDIFATKHGNLLMFEHYEVEDNGLKVWKEESTRDIICIEFDS